MKTLLKKILPFFVLGFIQVSMGQSSDELIDKWDLNVTMGTTQLPSWLEVKLSGNSTLVGHFVGHSGSARPISEVHFHEGVFDFSIPPQWDGKNDMHLSGTLKDGKLTGTLLSSLGTAHTFTGSPAPALDRTAPKAWGKSQAIFNGKDLSGWTPQTEQRTNQWTVEEGILKSPRSGVNLLSSSNYEDFKLHIEVRYPEHSNSGIYLRGRYEVQVEDSHGKAPSNILFGGIYGFLCPNEMAAHPAGEWQVFDITLVGRRVSIEANGKKIITDQIIPGITGGALNSDEAAPGPFMLQGDHGPVEYRNISIQLPQ